MLLEISSDRMLVHEHIMFYHPRQHPLMVCSMLMALVVCHALLTRTFFDVTGDVLVKKTVMISFGTIHLLPIDSELLSI